MDQTKELLTRQLDSENQKQSTMEDGSEEKTATVNGISQMYKLKIEEARLENECKAQEAERQDQKNDRIIGYIVDGLKCLLPLGVSVLFMNRGFKFEEEGVYKSQTFKNLFGKFRIK